LLHERRRSEGRGAYVHGGRGHQRVETAGKAKYEYTSEPLSLRQQGDRTVVTGRLTGNFPGSPVDLRFAFRLERGRIASLEIAP